MRESVRNLSKIDSRLLADDMMRRSPAEMLDSLGRLVSSGEITMEKATEIFAWCSKRRIVKKAREEALEAIDALLLHHVRAVGCCRTEDSEAAAKAVKDRVERALDNLVAAGQRSVASRWNLMVQSEEGRG